MLKKFLGQETKKPEVRRGGNWKREPTTPSGIRKDYKPPVNGASNKSHCEVCGVEIASEYKLCYKHYKEAQQIKKQTDPNKCPKCDNNKSPQYDLCISCANLANKGMTSGQIREAIAEHFYVYILKLNDGKFYVGQTRELRERLLEHKDGLVKSTVNTNPKMVWFTTVNSRESAERAENRLKQINKRDPREIRRMVINFKAMVMELDFE